MTAFPSPPPLDCLAIVEKIRSLFERSPVFCGARISDPQIGSEGRVSVEVGFGCGPALFRIVAPSAEKAYVLLYELAHAVVENDLSPPRPDCA
jgi:hypothetical protein